MPFHFESANKMHAWLNSDQNQRPEATTPVEPEPPPNGEHSSPLEESTPHRPDHQELKVEQAKAVETAEPQLKFFENAQPSLEKQDLEVKPDLTRDDDGPRLKFFEEAQPSLERKEAKMTDKNPGDAKPELKFHEDLNPSLEPERGR